MSYSKIIFNDNLTLSWVFPYTGGEVVSDINDMDATEADKGITLPPANLTELGTKVIFNNVGENKFKIHNYGATVEIWELHPGQIITIYLTSNLDAAGEWCAIPFGSGTSGVVSVGVSSNSTAMVVANTPINTGQSGTISLSLSDSITNLNNLTNTGFTAITQTGPLTWAARELIAGNNVDIENPKGIDGNPNISLKSIITDLVSLTAGTVNITENTISSVEPNGSLIINSKAAGAVIINGFTINPNGISVNPTSTVGKIQTSESTITTTEENGTIILASNGTGHIVANGVNIDASSNITAVNSLSSTKTVSGTIQMSASTITSTEANGSVAVESTGTGAVVINGISMDTTSNVTGINSITTKTLTVTEGITNAGIAVACCFFSDNNTLTVSNNTIDVYSKFNIASVTGGLGAYNVSFVTPLTNSNYIVQLTLSHGADTQLPFAAYFTDRATDQFKIVTIDMQGNLLPVTSGISVVVHGNIVD